MDRLLTSMHVEMYLPKQQGFYWAQWLVFEEGTRDRDELSATKSWIPVEVYENADVDSGQHLRVQVAGIEQSQSLSNFFWGWAAPIPLVPPSVGLTPSLPRLSPRELQTLRCLVIGLPNKAIAKKLGVAETTVKVHVKSLLRKLKTANRTQAAIWAIKNHQVCNLDDIALSAPEGILRLGGNEANIVQASPPPTAFMSSTLA